MLPSKKLVEVLLGKEVSLIFFNSNSQKSIFDLIYPQSISMKFGSPNSDRVFRPVWNFFTKIKVYEANNRFAINWTLEDA